MTADELAAALSPVRVPEEFARFGVQDALAAVALGLVAGLLIAALLRSVMVRRRSSRDEARAAIGALAARDREARITGLAALLRAHGGAPPEGLEDALYDPRTDFDPEPLEAAVIAAAGRRRRR